MKNREHWRRGFLVGFILALTFLIVLDQHRLQPWAYQFLLIAVVLSCANSSQAVGWLRVLTIGIYAHSAFSKFDASFLNTHGQELTAALFGAIGFSLNGLDESTRRLLAFALPVGEFLIAVGLCLPRFRRPAVSFAIVMHSVLLIALGPFGLNHRPGVLLWNVFFACQTFLLFDRTQDGFFLEKKLQADSFTAYFRRILGQGFRNVFAAMTVLTAVSFPFLEPFGMVDHWPGWALYASKPERVTMFVHVLKRDQLPEEIRKFTSAPEQGPWCRIDFDEWSLETLNAPIYPQGRFRLGVVRAVVDQANIGWAYRIVVESPANRRTGHRSSRTILEARTFQRETDQFWLNTKAR